MQSLDHAVVQRNKVVTCFEGVTGVQVLEIQTNTKFVLIHIPTKVKEEQVNNVRVREVLQLFTSTLCPDRNGITIFYIDMYCHSDRSKQNRSHNMAANC